MKIENYMKNENNYEVNFPAPPLSILGEHYFPTAKLTLKFVEEFVNGSSFQFDSLLISKPFKNEFVLSLMDAWVASLDELKELAEQESFKVKISPDFSGDFKTAGEALSAANEFFLEKGANEFKSRNDSLTCKLHTGGSEINISYFDLIKIYKLELGGKND